MQHSKHTGLNLKRKITASLLSLAILGTGTLPLVSTVVASAAEESDSSVGAKNGSYEKQDGIFWANAKYYDYLSDAETTKGWRNPIQAGTGHGGSNDDWYPFDGLNSLISRIAANDSSWSKPLYFGNFYNDNDGPYASSDHGGPYTSAIDGLTNFVHDPNNSRKGVVGKDSKQYEEGVTLTGIGEEHQSYQGLVQDSLTNDQLMVTPNTKAPYFDEDALGSYGQVIKSGFPFVIDNQQGYTKYSFKSSSSSSATESNNMVAEDNVYFTGLDGNSPVAHYSHGTDHAVRDGKGYFMFDDKSGYGIYPFNRTTTTTYNKLYLSTGDSGWDYITLFFIGLDTDWNNRRDTQWIQNNPDGSKNFYYDLSKISASDWEKVTGVILANRDGSEQTEDLSYGYIKDGAVYVTGKPQGYTKNPAYTWQIIPDDAGIQGSEKLDHGFGIRMDVNFRVPKGGYTSDGTTPISFDFAGDDDLWMFVTDNTTGESHLVLDMGGNHKKSVGKVTFLDGKMTGHVNAVANGSGDKVFDFDYTHTYKMTVFYMERGMIESNCDMSFTMTPLGNNVIVTEKINTTDINPGLVDDVTAASQFEFVAEDTDGNKETFSLGDDGRSDFPGTFTVGKDVKVTQKKKTDSSLVYDTTFDYTDNTAANPSKGNLGSGEGDSTKDVPTDSKNFLNESGDTYDYVEFQADYVNTPRVADVTLSKETVDFINQRLNSGDLGQSDSFPITVSLDFGGTNGPLYDFDYTVKNGNDTSEGTADKGKLTIKDGDTVTIPNVPIGTTVTVSEDISNSTNFDRKEVKPESFTVTKDGTNSSAITNIRKLPEPTTDKVTVNKTIFTKTFEDKSTATLGDGYKFELYYGETKLDTITITDPSSDTDSDVFKDLKFTVNEADKGKEAQGIFYIAPETFKNGGSKEFTFTVKEVLTDDQKKAIDQPADQTATIIIYYDKANNKLTNIPPDQVGSVPNPDHTTDFVNPYNVGSVSITKTVTRDSGELDDQDKNTAFTINVSFSFNGNTYPNGVPFYYTVNGGSKTYQLGSSQSISLKHGETASFDGLPVGTTVTVSESNPGAEYSPSVSPESVKITEKGQAFNVVVTNKRQAPGEAPVSVTKVLENADVAAKAGVNIENAKFEFTITENTAGAEPYSETVTAKSATVDFTPIKFDHAGTRTFTIAEATGRVPNVEYDKSVINVSITAANDGDKLKITETKYTDGQGNVLTAPTFTNKYKVGEVTFDKYVIDKDAKTVDSDNTEFTAQVKIKYPQETAFSVKPFKLNGETVDNEKGEITITNKGTYVITELPIGTEVEITETDAKGYLAYYVPKQVMIATEATNATAGGSNDYISDGSGDGSGITPPALSEVTVLNQKVELPVDITAKKVAEGFALKGEDFAFTLKGTGVSQTKSNDAQGNVKFDTITFEVRSDDKATGNNTIVIKPDQFTDDKYTAEYTIAETAGNNAFLTYDGTEYKATVTVTRTPRSDVEGLYTYAAAVDYGNATNTPPAFTNSWKKAPARIIKKVLDSDGKPYDTNETFKIDITYTYPADYTGDTTQFPASVSLNKANGFTATINDLPYNTGVAVNEADSKGMTPSYDPASKQITVDGTSTAENPVTITVTNKRQAPGTTSFPVQFKKQFNYGTLEADAFEFEMLEGDGLKGDKVKNTAQGVVDFGTVNVEYSKTAKDPANKTVYLDDSKFTDDIATLTYKAKEADGKKANIFYDGDEITYTVKIKRTVTAAQTTLEFVSGTYAKGKDNAESDTFVNNCLGDIKITKEVRNAADAEKAKPFKADVEIALMKADGTLSEFAAIPYIYTYEGGKTEATATLDLYDGRVYTLSGLPMGSQVKVTEQSAKYPNYSVTYDPQIVTVGETASTAKVINTLQAPGQVTLGVNKTFTQDALNAGVDLEAKGNKFSFTMTAEANNPVLKDYTSTVTLDKYQDGKLVTSGEFAAIVFPPEYAYGQGTDVAFKVVENSAIEGNDGSIIYDTATYSVVYTVKQGESGLDISAPVITKSKNGDTSAPGTVSFENGYPVGSVEIKKLVKDFDGANLEAYKTEAFPIKVTITTPDGTTDVKETTVSAAQSVKYDKLPYGTTVTVEETDAKGMTASIDKATVTVSKETPAPTVTITNTRETLNPTDVQVPAKKVIKGADIADYQQAFLFELNGNGITMQAQNDVKGDVLFDKINFRIKKSADDAAEKNTILVDKSAFASSDTVAYTFAVKEIPADRPDITFDNNTYNVTVNVKKTETLNAITLSASVDKTTVPTFTNQKLGRAILYKVVKDIDGTGFKPDVDFKFSLKVDGKVVKDDIIINVSKDETSRFVTGYYPVDTVLTFEETDAKGFECTEPVKTVTIIDETGEIPSAEVEFVNRRPQPGQTSITLSALKTVSGYKLSANDFSFTAKGKGLDETKKNNENGNIVFSTITYKYTKGNEADTGNTVYLRDGDFTDGKAVLNYEIKETKGTNTDITYASNTVKAVVTVKKTETASDIQLSATAAYPDGTTFNNPVRTGSATIIKKDQEGNPVDGIEFTLFKVTSDGLSRDEVLANGSVVDAKTTSGGKVTFNDLDLYKDASRTLSNPEYQWYCFAETDPGDNHNLNSELTFFRVPTEGVYDVEFTYMNGKITSPTSGGEGMFTFKLVGSILLAFASALLAGYVFFFSKKSGKKSAHSVK